MLQSVREPVTRYYEFHVAQHAGGTASASRNSFTNMQRLIKFRHSSETRENSFPGTTGPKL